MDEDKSPGAPLVFSYASNQQVFDFAMGELKQLVEQRIRGLEALGAEIAQNFSDYQGLTMDQHAAIAVLLVQHGFTDDQLLAAKGEPRKEGKNPRLIVQVSLVVNMTSRLIVGNHYIEEQRRKGLPTATQLDLTTQDMTRERFENFIAMRINAGLLSSSDVQGFEYSFKEFNQWFAYLKVGRCMNLVGRDGKQAPGSSTKHYHCLIALYFCRIHRLVHLPNGKLVVTRPGEMPSGDLGTYSDNSAARAQESDYVSWETVSAPVKEVQTAGDDCVDSNGDCTALYRELGKVITDYIEFDEEVHFCSTVFSSSGSYQENIEKSTVAACYRGNFSPEDESQFRACFEKHPKFKEYLELIHETVDWDSWESA